MFCKDYMFNLTKEVDGETKYLVWAEIYCDDAPDPLPTDATDIENFPQNFDPTKVQFSPGSVLYAVNTGDVYMADSTGTFIKQN